MKASENCLKIVRACEGFSAEPYLCPAKIPTIGYGSTTYADGTKVTLNDPPISEDAAGELMLATLEKFEQGVEHLVTVELTQNQFDALVDFAYNCGLGNLRSSTLLKKVNAGEWAAAGNEFLRWNRGGGKVLAGLTKRRQLEKDLFES